jgi:conjugal transfer/entry exclusion protein
MNYLLEKTHILEIKLKLTSILLDKQECIRNQQYEKVADLRLEEKELLGKLNEKKNSLIELQNNLENLKQSIEESDYLTILIEEIKLQESSVRPVPKNSESKTTNSIEAFDQINQIKNDVLKEHNKDESN